MPLTIVQRASLGSAANVATLTVPLGSTAVAGHLLLGIFNCDSTVSTPSGYAVANSKVNATGLYAFTKIAGGTETSLAASPVGGSFSIEGVVWEFSGNTATPLDKTAAGANGSGATGTTATTSQADELAVAAVGTNNSSTVHAASWTNSFVTELEVVGLGSLGTVLHTASLALSATGAITTTGSMTGETISGALIVTLKASGGGGVTVKQLTALGVG